MKKPPRKAERPAGRRWVEITLRAPAAAEDEMAAMLSELGALGVEVDMGLPGEPPGDPIRMRAFFENELSDGVEKRIRERLRSADALHPKSRLLAVSSIEDGRWAERWMEALEPFDVGERLRVEPVADLDETLPFKRRPVGMRIPLRICPSRAFGTGEHPTTRMCLLALEQAELAGRSFLDVGTGSGILAIAADLLGAAPVVAIDNDAEAVEVAIKNAVQNERGGSIRFLHGEIAAAGPDRFDVVAANLNGTLLDRLLPDIVERLAPGGTLILSGLLEGESAEIETKAARLRLGPARMTRQGGWACLVFDAQRG